MLYSLLTAIAASVLSISPTPATRPGEVTTAPTPPPEIVAANDAVQGFVQALGRSEWSKALGYGSAPVQEAARKYPSPEAFLRDMVPIKLILAETKNPVYRWSVAKGGFARGWSISPLGGKVTELEPDPADKWGLSTRREVRWLGRAKQVDSRWVIDFDITPLRQYIDKELAELTRIRREAIANETALEPKLSKVRTRLVPLARRYQAGKPMLFRLELINEGPAKLVYDRSGVGNCQAMIVKTADGQSVHWTGGCPQTEMGHEIINPGQTVVLLDKWDLGSEYKLTMPGTYTVQFRGGIPIAETHPYKTVRFGRADTNKIEVLPAAGRASRRLFPSNIVRIEVVTNETVNTPRK